MAGKQSPVGRCVRSQHRESGNEYPRQYPEHANVFFAEIHRHWLLLQDTDYPDGAAYLEDFSGDISKPGDVRKEPDGSISVKAGGGYNFHFYPSDRATINPNDIGGILIILEARLIVDNSALPDDRSSAKYLCGAGADYYPSLTGGWPGNLSYNPGVGIGKMKLVRLTGGSLL